MQRQAVELLLLLGQIHEAAGAPLTALPYVLSCQLHSTQLHMDILVSSILSHICCSPGYGQSLSLAADTWTIVVSEQ